MPEQTPVTVGVNDVQVKQLSACESALVLAKRQKDQAGHLLIALSRDGDPMVRIRAAECLMEIGGERAVIGLMGLLDDPHTQVRITAIGALGVLRAHGARDKLLAVLKSDPEVPVRIIAARTLGRMGNRTGLLLILRLLDEDNEFYQRLAVMALRDIIGQTFSPTREGIRSAKRYLDMSLDRYLNGG